MSNTYILAAFAGMIGLLIFLVSKVKLHQVLSLLLVTIMLGLFLGTPLDEIPSTIHKGFGDACKSVALVIFLGSLLGHILGETGAAVRLTNTLIRWFGKKRVLWAVAVSCTILGIPIFPDTIGLLIIPICSNVAATTGISMSAFSCVVSAGIITSSLVPPTPGPVAAAAFLGLPLGVVIPWGILVSIPGMVAIVLFAKTRTAPIKPKEEYLHGMGIAEDKLPSFARSLTPIMLPVGLIVCYTVMQNLAPDSGVTKIFGFVGEPLSALLIGVFAVVFLTVDKWWKRDEVKGAWIEESLRGAAMPIFVTALGGSLALFIKNTKVANSVADLIVSASIPGIYVPMAISIAIRIITGSNTLALMTTAALVEPMLKTIGVSPLAAYLAMASGGIIFSHANSSGLWLNSSMSNLDFKEALKSIGGGTFISGAACCVFTVLLDYMGAI